MNPPPGRPLDDRDVLALRLRGREGADIADELGIDPLDYWRAMSGLPIYEGVRRRLIRFLRSNP